MCDFSPSTWHDVTIPTQRQVPVAAFRGFARPREEGGEILRTFLLIVLLFSLLLYSPTLFAFLLFVVALFDVIYISDEHDRVCPKCQEFISPNARKCPYCDYKLPLRLFGRRLRGRQQKRSSESESEPES